MLLRSFRAWGAGEDEPATRRHVCFIAEILIAMRGSLGYRYNSTVEKGNTGGKQMPG